MDNEIRRVTQWLSNVIPLNVKGRSREITVWILAGCIIRVFLMPIFGSEDFATNFWVSLTLLQKHQLVSSVDPPLIFLLLDGFYFILAPLFPSEFVKYLTSSTSFTPPLLLQNFAYLQPGANIILFLGKIPFLIFDILSSLIILHFFDDEKKALLALKIWILNPVSIYVSYVIGQYDIIPIFFILLSLLLLKKEKFDWATFTLGIAGAIKIFALALIPLVAIYYLKLHKEWSFPWRMYRTIRIFILGLLPLLSIPIALITIPRYYESVNAALPHSTLFNGFLGTTFFARGIAVQPLLGILSFLLDLSLSVRTQNIIPDYLYAIPLAYVAVLLWTWYYKRPSFRNVWIPFTVFLLIYYATSLFNVQWFLWIQPFLVLLAVERREDFGRLWIWLMPFFFAYTLYWDAASTTKLLTPIIPQAVTWPGLVTMLNNAGIPGYAIISVLRTIFSTISLFIAFRLVRRIPATARTQLT